VNNISNVVDKIETLISKLHGYTVHQ